jgi:hypothetical protein
MLPRGCTEHTRDGPCKATLDLAFALSRTCFSRNRHVSGRAGLAGPLQFAHQIARRLPAIVRILGEARGDDAIERLRREPLQRRNRRRIVFEDRTEQRRASCPRTPAAP